MPLPQYRRIQRDLAIARPAPGEVILQVGEVFDAIIPFNVPAGSGVTIQLGPNTGQIPLELMPPIEICPPADQGLFLINPLGAGIVDFLVSFGTVQASG